MKKDITSGILYREWKSPSPKAVILLVHGLGAHSGRWVFLGDFFLKNSFSSYAIELRGFGQTPGPKGHADSLKIYFNDIRRLYNIIKSENPGKKIFLAGESLGAVISFLLSMSQGRLFSGLICMSPAFKTALNFTIRDYLKIFLPVFYNPSKQFDMPFDSAMCTRDTDYIKIMEEEKLEHRLASSRLLAYIAVAQILCRILKNRLQIPVLFLIAGSDTIVDPDASRAIFSKLRLKDKKIVEYPDMFHSISVDLGRERVFQDILTWVEERL